jgi:hypothetical protein
VLQQGDEVDGGFPGPASGFLRLAVSIILDPGPGRILQGEGGLGQTVGASDTELISRRWRS